MCHSAPLGAPTGNADNCPVGQCVKLFDEITIFAVVNNFMNQFMLKLSNYCAFRCPESF